MKDEEKEIKKARAETVKAIEQAIPSLQNGTCGYLATHLAKYTDSNVPYGVAWYSEEPKRLESPYLSFESVQSEDVDGAITAAICRPTKILCKPADRAWKADGDTDQLRTHLQKDDALAREIFGSCSMPYEDIRELFLSVPKCPPPQETSKMLHQVYFPMVNGSYHLLSVLPSPVVMNELRKRISSAWKQKENAEEDNEPYDVPNSTVPIAFGGQHPLNVGILAFHAGSRGFPAFCSAAPNFRPKPDDRPRSDFFRHCYRTKSLKDDFILFFSALRRRDRDERRKLKDARDRILDAYLEQIYLLRALPAHWSDEESIHLAVCEKRFLDSGYAKELTDMDFEDFCNRLQAFARILFERLMKNDKLSFHARTASALLGEPFYNDLHLCFS